MLQIVRWKYLTVISIFKFEQPSPNTGSMYVREVFGLKSHNPPLADVGGGGTREAPRRPNSFKFMQFFGEIRQNRYVGAPGSWRPLLGEILDPPL